MKKLVMLVLASLIAMFMLSGCGASNLFTLDENGNVIGKKTGTNYSVLYKIIKEGLVLWVDADTLAKYNAEKVDITITGAYKIIEAVNAEGKFSELKSTEKTETLQQ